MISAVLKAAGHDVSFFDTSRFGKDAEENSLDRSEKSINKMKQVLQFLPVDLPPIERAAESVFSALHSRIKLFAPDLIGFSSTSSEFPYLVTILEEIKKYGIPTIVGGTHATVAPLEVVAVDGIDMVLVGEGEEAILELVTAMGAGLKRTDIRNVYFYENGACVQNEVRPYIRNMDSLPFMDIDIFDKYHHMGAYQGGLVTYARIEAGRGCPYKCTYCVNAMLHDDVYGHEKQHVRNKSPQRVIDELAFVSEKINCGVVRFVDETFTACSVEWLEEFVGLYTERINKGMIVATRPEYVSERKMEILRKAHEDIQVTMGIESGCEELRRDVLNRRMTNDSIVKAFHLCNELGFRTAAFNMIGLPGETRKEFLETIDLNVKAQVQVPMLSYFYPFKGCKLRDMCIEKGYLEEGLHEVDYSVSSVLDLPGFSHEEIEGLKRTFVMYVKMDESLYSEIQQAETDDMVFGRLVDRYGE